MKRKRDIGGERGRNCLLLTSSSINNRSVCGNGKLYNINTKQSILENVYA